MPNETTVDLKTALEKAIQSYREGRIDEAENIYLAVLAKFPENGLANFHLGAIRQSEGNFEKAAALFQKALEVAPQEGRIHFALARCRKFEAGDPYFGTLENLVATDSLDNMSRVLINFALAKMYDDIGEQDRAFSFSRAANEHQDASYDPKAHHEFMNRVMAVFDKEFFATNAAIGSVTDRYVFVVGLPRTGTTLVDQIISSHPNAYTAGELLYFHAAASGLQEWLKSDKPYPECLYDIQRPIVVELIERYHALFRNLSGELLRITNKFPENFRVLGLIGLLFPRARIIRCTRDEMDVGLSIYAHNLPLDNHAYSCRLEDIGHYTLEYERLMAHWREVLPNPWHEVRYEGMIGDREVESRKLIEFLGLEWDEKCLEFHKNRNRVGTESVWQVRQPAYSTSVGRWKKVNRQMEPLKRALEAGLAEDGTLAVK